VNVWVSDPSGSHVLRSDIAQPLNSLLAYRFLGGYRLSFSGLPPLWMVTDSPDPRLNRARGRSHACTCYPGKAMAFNQSKSI